MTLDQRQMVPPFTTQKRRILDGLIPPDPTDYSGETLPGK